MMRKFSFIIVELVALLLLMLHCTDATTYTVGDALNWVDPPTSTTYSIWASSHVFVKDDVLVFNFNKGIHNVAEVTKKAYNNCNTSSLISPQHQPPVRVTLPKTGIRYFISTLNNDCQNGQKLAISVLQHLPPPPPPPPATPPSTSVVAPGPNNPPLPSNIAVTPPPPSTNSAPSYIGPNNVTLSHVLLTLILGLLCQYISST